MKGVGFKGETNFTQYKDGGRFFVADSGTTYAMVPTEDLLAMVHALSLKGIHCKKTG